MNRLSLLIFFVCMFVPVQAADYRNMGYRNDISEMYQPIDSIVLNIESFSDDIKITVTLLQGNIKSTSNRSYAKTHKRRKEQRLCEWQRKEIFEALIDFYITKTKSIVKDRIPMPSNYVVEEEPITICYATFYFGNQSRKEELTLHYSYKNEKLIYTDEFGRFYSLIDAIRMAYLQGIPWVC